MNEARPPITPFDEMIQDDHTQLLKAALPYLPRQSQGLLSLYAKTRELKNTLAFFSNPMQTMEVCQAAPSADPMEMLTELSRYVGNPLKEQLEQMTEAFAMLQMLDTLQDSESRI